MSQLKHDDPWMITCGRVCNGSRKICTVSSSRVGHKGSTFDWHQVGNRQLTPDHYWRFNWTMIIYLNHGNALRIYTSIIHIGHGAKYWMTLLALSQSRRKISFWSEWNSNRGYKKIWRFNSDLRRKMKKITIAKSLSSSYLTPESIESLNYQLNRLKSCRWLVLGWNKLV